jgi:hypothetical protein
LKQVHCPVLAIHGELDEFGSLVHPENICTWAQALASGNHCRRRPCAAPRAARAHQQPHRGFLSKIA